MDSSALSRTLLAIATLYALRTRRSRPHTTGDIKLRWRPECAARLPQGSDNRVVVQFGINDVAHVAGEGIRVPLEESLQNARQIIAGLSELYQLLWIGMPPANTPCSPMKPSPGMVIDFDQDRAIEYNAVYRDLARVLQADYLDIQTPLLDDPEYMAGLTRGDGMHCDGRGYEIMTDLIDSWSSWAQWFDAPGYERRLTR